MQRRLRNDLYCVEWDVKLYYNIYNAAFDFRWWHCLNHTLGAFFCLQVAHDIIIVVIGEVFQVNV